MITRGLTPEMREYIPAQGNMANLSRMLHGLQGSRVAVDLRDDVFITATATFDSPEAASQMASALKGLAGLGRLTTPNDQLDLLRVYDSLKAEATANSVDAALTIQAEQLPRLMEMLPAGALTPQY